MLETSTAGNARFTDAVKLIRSEDNVIESTVFNIILCSNYYQWVPYLNHKYRREDLILCNYATLTISIVPLSTMASLSLINPTSRRI